MIVVAVRPMPVVGPCQLASGLQNTGGCIDRGSIVVEDQPDDGMSVGRGFLRAMAEQSERARAFNRQMLWFRLRRLPADREPDRSCFPLPDDVVVLPDAGQPTIDLTASAEQAVPRQRG